MCIHSIFKRITISYYTTIVATCHSSSNMSRHVYSRIYNATIFYNGTRLNNTCNNTHTNILIYLVVTTIIKHRIFNRTRKIAYETRNQFTPNGTNSKIANCITLTIKYTGKSLLR